MSRSMLHWNGDLLCAIDTETSGLDPFFHEILQICVLPLDANIEPIRDVLPFYLNMIPEDPQRADPQALKKNKLKLTELALTGYDKIKAIDLFEEWVVKLKLPTTKWGTPKKLMPLGQNYSFDKPFIMKWLGTDVYNQYFNYHHHDTMVTAHYLNDRAAYHAEKVPFNKTNLQWLCTTLNIQSERAHDALSDCLSVAAVYKKMLQRGPIF
jgi:DNA polymerase III epsilon subunit-like protein